MAGMDLLQLRGAMKRDPKAYEDELSLQLRHFQVSVEGVIVPTYTDCIFYLVISVSLTDDQAMSIFRLQSKYSMPAHQNHHRN